MQTYPAVEQNKKVEWSENSWSQSAGKKMEKICQRAKRSEWKTERVREDKSGDSGEVKVKETVSDEAREVLVLTGFVIIFHYKLSFFWSPVSWRHSSWDDLWTPIRVIIRPSRVLQTRSGAQCQQQIASVVQVW